METRIWTEKYRPSNFEGVVGQDDIVKRVKNLTNSMNIPQLNSYIKNNTKENPKLTAPHHHINQNCQ